MAVTKLKIMDQSDMTTQVHVKSKESQLLSSDTFAVLSDGYVTAAARKGGLVVNYLPTATATTPNGNFVAGVASTSNPTLTTTGSATFGANDLIMMAGSTSNDGIYEVLTHSGTTLTVRGVGTTATVEAFSKTQFIAETGAGTVTKINVAILQVNVAGEWQVASGSSTGLTFNAMNSGEIAAQAAMTKPDLAVVLTDEVYLVVPAKLNGKNLVSAEATVVTAGAGGNLLVNIDKLRGTTATPTVTADLLSTAITLAAATTVATAGVVDSAKAQLLTNDRLKVKVTAPLPTTSPKGLSVVLGFS